VLFIILLIGLFVKQRLFKNCISSTLLSLPYILTGRAPRYIFGNTCIFDNQALLPLDSPRIKYGACLPSHYHSQWNDGVGSMAYILQCLREGEKRHKTEVISCSPPMIKQKAHSENAPNKSYCSL